MGDRRSRANATAAQRRLGHARDTAHPPPYARHAEQLAVVDLDPVEEFEAAEERRGAAAAFTVPYEPGPLSLRRPAEAEESNRRFDAGD
ncbi:hypothetical protein ACIRPT_30115 [Streptomyces sp. NPDC101227]|uniref:hypothetical protein n=1 Tax=Streptomyces sp. NPDC101227 TaxID=3366136 RepID=UPI003812F75F